MSPYHVEGGGDILYQIGPGEFGCRTHDGRVDDEKAAAIMALPQVKMIEIKPEQGAKPGKGGLLPKEKLRGRAAGARRLRRTAVDALTIVDNALRREGLRDVVTVHASGKIATGGEVATHMALGADIVHIGRGFLFSLGSIQALRCHTNTCPTGVTTQNRWLQSGLNPADKSVRVFNYAMAVERDLQMITHACGLEHPSQLTREHVVVNVSPGARKSLMELFPYPKERVGEAYCT